MTRSTVLAVFALGLWCAPLSAQSFKRADANASDVTDLSDAVFGLNFLFSGGATPTCLDAADTNDDGKVDISDPVALLAFLFLGGTPPAAPFPDCGPDSTADDLGCELYMHCGPACYGQADLDQALVEKIEPIVCVAGGSVEPLVLEGFLVTVCPTDLAVPCPAPDSAAKGCPIEFTNLQGALDVPGRQVVLRIEGLAKDFPIRVEDQTFGTVTDCRLNMDFTGDVILAFTATPDAGGRLIVGEILTPSLENADITLSTKSNSLICRAIVALQEQFVAELLAQLEAAANELLADLNEELLGKELCQN